MSLVENFKAKAKQSLQHIVLPEGHDERTLRAASQVVAEGIAKITVFGNPEELKAKAAEFGITNMADINILDPHNNPNKERYVELMLKLRGNKGLTQEKAEELIVEPLYLGVMMVKSGDADGEVAGAANATGDVLRPAFQYIKTKPGISVVSGAFIMIVNSKFGENGMMLFADCAVHPNPTAAELAQIAVSTGHTARAVAGIEPKIAMLSFSTKGSGKHEMVDKVVEATRIAQEMDPSLMIDGEIQADAAIVEAIGNSKAPGSPVAGKANVLVFPTLEVGNISYKLVQRMANAEAIGPVLQGMAAPINDLSRGCSMEDIVNLVAITACQSQEEKANK